MAVLTHALLIKEMFDIKLVVAFFMFSNCIIYFYIMNIPVWSAV